MKTIKILKNLSYVFYSLTGLTVIIFPFALMNTEGGYADKTGVTFAVLGLIFLSLGFVFSFIAFFIIKMKNQPQDLPNDISTYLGPRNNSEKMFKIGYSLFLVAGFFILVAGLIQSFGEGDIFTTSFFILLTVPIFAGLISFVLAIMRYFKK